MSLQRRRAAVRRFLARSDCALRGFFLRTWLSDVPNKICSAESQTAKIIKTNKLKLIMIPSLRWSSLISLSFTVSIINRRVFHKTDNAFGRPAQSGKQGDFSALCTDWNDIWQPLTIRTVKQNQIHVSDWNKSIDCSGNLWYNFKE